MHECVEEIALEKGVTPAQPTLPWVQAQQHRAAGVVSIPGTTKEKNLLSTVGSAVIALTKAEIQMLEAAVPTAEGYRAHHNVTMVLWEGDNNRHCPLMKLMLLG